MTRKVIDCDQGNQQSFPDSIPVAESEGIQLEGKRVPRGGNSMCKGVEMWEKGPHISLGLWLIDPWVLCPIRK